MTKKLCKPKKNSTNSNRTLTNIDKRKTNRAFTFSFELFDRNHELFNLGCKNNNTLNSAWYIDLLDCFKSVNSKTFAELKQSLHDLHGINWKNTNTRCPGDDQLEYYQFRINKSKGRVIGTIVDNVFYIIWLDPHHNLTNSEGYGKETYYHKAKSEYELLCEEIIDLKRQLSESEEMLNELTSPKNGNDKISKMNIKFD